jgi:hypothetical protein
LVKLKKSWVVTSCMGRSLGLVGTAH